MKNMAHLSEDEAGKRWSELRPERDAALALVDEVEELSGDLLASLAHVEVLALEHRSIPFLVAEARGDLAGSRK